MNRARPYVVTLLVLMIAGCGTSPTVHYYGMETIDVDYTKDPTGSLVLALGPFRVPEYLNRSQMVIRGANAEMIVDDINHWAEPINDAIHRILASNVDSFLGSMVVLAYPTSALLDLDYRLSGRIIRFDSDQTGMIVLEVQWGAGDIDGNVLVAPGRGRYTSQATTPGNPGSIALAMSDALAQFSRDIAREIGSAVRD